MKKGKVLYFILLIAFIFFIFGCAAKRITYQRLRPPKYNVINVRTLAVLDFAPYQDRFDSGKVVANSVVTKLFPTGFYKLIERSQLERVITEHHFNLSGYIDEDTAAEIGKLVGADAVIVGEVTAFNFSDRTETRYKTVRVRTGRTRRVYNEHKKAYEQVPVYKDEVVPYDVYTRQGSVAANFRMIKVETGDVLASFTKHFDFSKEGKDLGSFPSIETLYNSGVDKITTEFAQEIAPYSSNVSRPILRTKTTQAKNAYKLARGGLWEEALDSWLAAIQLRPDDDEIYHNIGVAYEVLGDLKNAEANYSKALALNPKKSIYIEDVRYIRHIIKEQDKLRKIGL